MTTDPPRTPTPTPTPEEDWTRTPARPLAAIVLLALVSCGVLIGLVEGRTPHQPHAALAAAAPTTILIDVNTASAAQLDLLPNIGPARAEAIIRERTLYGPFSSLEDLERVKGIGPRTVEKLRGLAIAGVTDAE